MGSHVPDRWLDYRPIGRQIEGTRFIAFKVPLRTNVIKSLDKKLCLDNNILLEKVPNLGLIIDLTNTYRYYNPEHFIEAGVDYRKLCVPGRETPSPELVKQFKKHVKDFLLKNVHNDKLIGVHCTHGVNRTGFFVCNYMIMEMNMEPEAAIRKFNRGRGHNIERENYLDALKVLKQSHIRQQESPLPTRNRKYSETQSESSSNMRRMHCKNNHNSVMPSSSRCVQDVYNDQHRKNNKLSNTANNLREHTSTIIKPNTSKNFRADDSYTSRRNYNYHNKRYAYKRHHPYNNNYDKKDNKDDYYASSNAYNTRNNNNSYRSKNNVNYTNHRNVNEKYTNPFNTNRGSNINNDDNHSKSYRYGKKYDNNERNNYYVSGQARKYRRYH